jgi:hypothetical protein
MVGIDKINYSLEKLLILTIKVNERWIHSHSRNKLGESHLWRGATRLLPSVLGLVLVMLKKVGENLLRYEFPLADRLV